ncbi:hypothetical protein MUS_4241 [Bacillus velezensis YAU B9601-Y2]|uniref:Uncharacterized protein n=1 Tax=Bacillus amyloliquefaciens (strain Y2) TaxID=1155777 RepID=I2CBQ0_BACAY|nr:hypothetical protein MUS_4241 [Bacillus velezensis YAU B9601-Y2]RUR98097.1 hypothetical protein EFW57_02471 [Bacillus velezensis]
MLCCPYIRRVSPQSGSLQNHEDYFIKKSKCRLWHLPFHLISGNN